MILYVTLANMRKASKNANARTRMNGAGSEAQPESSVMELSTTAGNKCVSTLPVSLETEVKNDTKHVNGGAIGR